MVKLFEYEKQTLAMCDAAMREMDTSVLAPKHKQTQYRNFDEVLREMTSVRDAIDYPLYEIDPRKEVLLKAISKINNLVLKSHRRAAEHTEEVDAIGLLQDKIEVLRGDKREGMDERNRPQIVELSNQIAEHEDKKAALAVLQQNSINDVEATKDKILECFHELWTENDGRMRKQLTALRESTNVLKAKVILKPAQAAPATHDSSRALTRATETLANIWKRKNLKRCLSRTAFTWKTFVPPSTASIPIARPN